MPSLALLLYVYLSFCTSQALGASQTWKTSGFTDGNWNMPTNWIGGLVPGQNSTNGLSGDTATFNGPNNLMVTVDSTRSVNSILFDTNSAGSFTLQTGTLYVTNGGSISVSDTVVNSQTINSAIFLSPNGSASYLFANDSITRMA